MWSHGSAGHASAWFATLCRAAPLSRNPTPGRVGRVRDPARSGGPFYIMLRIVAAVTELKEDRRGMIRWPISILAIVSLCAAQDRFLWKDPGDVEGNPRLRESPRTHAPLFDEPERKSAERIASDG